MLRYAMRNKGKGTEFPYNFLGLEAIKQERKTNPIFKHARIKEIVQLQPSKITIGEVYSITY